VQSVDHLLRCYRYIELDSVRARVVSRPSHYTSSSYAAHAQVACSSAHPQYLALHAEGTARQHLYCDWIQSAITPEEVDEIRRRLKCQHAFGTERFRQRIEEQLQRRAGSARIGRPRKSARHAPADSR
jgi:putative transposase